MVTPPFTGLPATDLTHGRLVYQKPVPELEILHPGDHVIATNSCSSYGIEKTSGSIVQAKKNSQLTVGATGDLYLKFGQFLLKGGPQGLAVRTRYTSFLLPEGAIALVDADAKAPTKIVMLDDTAGNGALVVAAGDTHILHKGERLIAEGISVPLVNSEDRASTAAAIAKATEKANELALGKNAIDQAPKGANQPNNGIAAVPSSGIPANVGVSGGPAGSPIAANQPGPAIAAANAVAPKVATAGGLPVPLDASGSPMGIVGPGGRVMGANDAPHHHPSHHYGYGGSYRPRRISMAKHGVSGRQVHHAGRAPMIAAVPHRLSHQIASHQPAKRYLAHGSTANHRRTLGGSAVAYGHRHHSHAGAYAVAHQSPSLHQSLVANVYLNSSNGDANDSTVANGQRAGIAAAGARVGQRPTARASAGTSVVAGNLGVAGANANSNRAAGFAASGVDVGKPGLALNSAIASAAANSGAPAVAQRFFKGDAGDDEAVATQTKHVKVKQVIAPHAVALTKAQTKHAHILAKLPATETKVIVTTSSVELSKLIATNPLVHCTIPGMKRKLEVPGGLKKNEGLAKRLNGAQSSLPRAKGKDLISMSMLPVEGDVHQTTNAGASDKVAKAPRKDKHHIARVPKPAQADQGSHLKEVVRPPQVARAPQRSHLKPVAFSATPANVAGAAKAQQQSSASSAGAQDASLVALSGNKFRLSNGPALFHPNTTSTVELPVGTVSAGAGSVVYLAIQDHVIHIIDLRDASSKSVTVDYAGHHFTMNPGFELCVLDVDADQAGDFIMSDGLARRDMRIFSFADGKYVVASDVSVGSALLGLPRLGDLHRSTAIADKALLASLIKMAACLSIVLDPTRGPYTAAANSTEQLTDSARVNTY